MSASVKAPIEIVLVRASKMMKAGSGEPPTRE